MQKIRSMKLMLFSSLMILCSYSLSGMESSSLASPWLSGPWSDSKPLERLPLQSSIGLPDGSFLHLAYDRFAHEIYLLTMKRMDDATIIPTNSQNIRLNQEAITTQCEGSITEVNPVGLVLLPLGYLAVVTAKRYQVNDAVLLIKSNLLSPSQGAFKALCLRRGAFFLNNIKIKKTEENNFRVSLPVKKKGEDKVRKIYWTLSEDFSRSSSVEVIK